MNYNDRLCRRKRCHKPRSEHRLENNKHLCSDGQVYHAQTHRTTAASQSFRPGEVSLGRRILKALSVGDHNIFALAQDPDFASTARKFQTMDKRLETLKGKI